MLSSKIKVIYPDITRNDFGRLGSIILRDEGAGPYIAAWNHPIHPQPTQEQLDAIVIAPDAPEIPEVISSRQLRLQLRAMGRLAAVKNYILAADEPTQIYFEYETFIRRDAPEILAMQAYFSLTNKQMDDLFTAAHLL